MSVRDSRSHGFWFVTHDAIDALHEAFPRGDSRAAAMAVYGALAAGASNARRVARGVEGNSFEATRDVVADYAGVSLSTLDRITRRLVDAQLLAVETLPSRAKIWTLRDPDEVDEEAAESEAGCVTMTQQVRHGDAAGCVTMTHPSYAGADEAKKEEGRTAERDARAVAICERVGKHVERIDPDGRLPAGAPLSDSWLVAAIGLIEEDGRDVDQVLELLDWIGVDDFWRSRILSPADLRRHYTRAYGVATSGRSGNGKPLRLDLARDAEARLQREANAGHCCLEAGAAPSSAEDEWRQLANALKTALAASIWDIWLAHAHPHAGADGELLLAMPEHKVAWVRDRYGQAIDDVAGRHIEIVYCEESTP